MRAPRWLCPAAIAALSLACAEPAPVPIERSVAIEQQSSIPREPAAAPIAAEAPAIAAEAIAEGPDSRDPFRPFLEPTVRPPKDPPRKSKRYAIDQLRLVALVTRVDTPRAMLVDPTGKGWIVTPGEIVGRPEVVRAGGGEHAMSWRVDRIRANDVVLVREDPARPELPMATRVLALRTDPPRATDDD
jgi:hypothetical protein